MDNVERMFEVWNSKDEFLPMKKIPKLFEIIRIQHNRLVKWENFKAIEASDLVEAFDDNELDILETNRLAGEVIDG